MHKSTVGLVLPVIAALFATSGCGSPRMEMTGTPNGQNKTVQLTPSFDRFPDMPLPNGFEFDMARTLIFGSEDSWFGRMAVRIAFGPNEMFDFYKQELPRFGWQEVTAIRAPVSVLTYTRSERVATLQIESRTLGGSDILITVSPKGMPVESGVAPGGRNAGGMPAPVAPVQTIR